MILITILLISLLIAYLGIKHNRWQMMAVSSVIVAILYLIGFDSVVQLFTDIVTWAASNSQMLLSVLLLLVLASTFAIWNNKCDEKRDADREKKKRAEAIGRIEDVGFVEPQADGFVSGWESYVSSVASRMVKSKLKNESFALGIAGDWGSGKTTFLGLLKAELKKYTIVIDFNPWVCTSSQLVIADFFKTLNNALPAGNKPLSDDIQKYVKLLTDTEVVPGAVSSLMDFWLPLSDESLNELRSDIETKLNESDTQYTILIDDLDRLEHQELFEVLRLIRITASFSNLQFVVTYDRHHIREMLKKSGIDNGDVFVKKIFNTEIVLPEMEPYVLPQMLLKELSRLLGEDSPIITDINDSILIKDEFGNYRLLDYLHNFRDIKRFAMAFAADISDIQKNTPKEFSFDEFYWVDLLRYVDYDVYKNLRNYPLHYLALKDQVLLVKDNLDEELEGHPLAISIIKHLFHHQADSKRPANSIAFKNNYHNYFSFRIQKDKVTYDEYGKLLKKSAEDIKTAFEQYWRENKIMSLYEITRQTQPSSLLTEEETIGYIQVLFCLMNYMTIGCVNTVNEKLQEDLYVGKDKAKLAAEVKSIITAMGANTTVKREQLNFLLAKLHSRCAFDSTDEYPERYSNKTLVDDDFLVAEAVKNLSAILNGASKPISICSFTKVGAGGRRLLESGTVNYYTDITDEDGIPHYRCLPFDAFLQYFKEHPSDQLDAFLKPFEFGDDEISYYEDEQCFNDRLNTIEKVFGTLSNFKKVINVCFINTDEEKEAKIKYWQIEKVKY